MSSEFSSLQIAHYDPHINLLSYIVVTNWVGKGKNHETKNSLQTNTKRLTKNHFKLDKFTRIVVHDGKITEVSKLIRIDIHDSFDHTTRNLLQSTTNLLLNHIGKTQTVVSRTWDHITHCL